MVMDQGRHTDASNQRNGPFEGVWFRRILVQVLLLSLLGTGYFSIKTYRSFMVLQSARSLDIPAVGNIRAWMTLDYVVNAHGADPTALLAELDLPADLPTNLTLKTLAERTGRGSLDYVQMVQRALTRVPLPGTETVEDESEETWRSAVNDWFFSTLLIFGYPVLGLVLFFGALGLPVPAGPLATIAGSLAQHGDLNWLVAGLAALAASVLGDLAAYMAGRLLPLEFLQRHGRWIGYTETNRRRLDRLFARWGGLTMVLTRSLVSYVAAIASILAGAGRYSPARFLAYSVAGRSIWVVAYFGIGYLVGTEFQVASGFLGYLSMDLICLALLLGSGKMLFVNRPVSPASP